MAGGLQPTAKSSQIAVLRRAPNGGMMMRTINIGRGLKNIRQYNDVIQLRRGDIIFVPRNSLSEIGVWVQAVRNALPVDFNISYQIGNGGNGLSPVITTP
jgi:polysaccharide export outer membrane protein